MSNETPPKECAPEETVREDPPEAVGEAEGPPSPAESRNGTGEDEAMDLFEDSDDYSPSAPPLEAWLEIEFYPMLTPPATPESGFSDSDEMPYILPADRCRKDFADFRPCALAYADVDLDDSDDSPPPNLPPSPPTSNSDADPDQRNNNVDENCVLCGADVSDLNLCKGNSEEKEDVDPNSPKEMKSDPETAEVPKKPETGPEDSSVAEALQDDNAVGTTKPEPSDDAVAGPSQPSTSNSEPEENPALTMLKNDTTPRDLCAVCFSKPLAGVFLHPQSAHLYGCYPCAKKIWMECGFCPLCREKVSNVVKLS